ncbi:SDR family NAD(P)-dependent oxidoreductase [Chitinophaga filiformis]|uniref:NAD(P)-dependent dehydrogenase, short-chain alcohol dehydrogenase family n=1 Tax=Chitinophaga filiformis TaxID=104663 RepID=A0A1G7NLM7_CHIFI|nr:glucose 1-dehydrogenase [Chitinophaga filiformis]SDF75025.1 NAD(P)-dependent dehydrogenase, short-chain alcohol dehydrogenase family [Chitinophaga filiformis]
MKKLENKVAVITGATSGLALATAQLFVAEGAYVFITGRRKKELDEAVKTIGHNVTGVQADSGKLEDLDRLIDTVEKEKGRIDVLYVSAGIGDFGVPIGTVTEEIYQKTFDVNVKGTIFTVQKALPLLTDGGSIIMTGSIAGIKAFPGMGVYSASKAAIRSLARTWTVDLQARKIRVNVIAPGHTDTNVFAGFSQEVLDGLAKSVPLERMGKPEEIAKAALFLASDDSSYIAGTELYVDGGAAQI